MKGNETLNAVVFGDLSVAEELLGKRYLLQRLSKPPKHSGNVVSGLPFDLLLIAWIRERLINRVGLLRHWLGYLVPEQGDELSW